MKTKITSLFLCLVLICGVLSTGLSVPVAANESYYTVKSFSTLKAAFNQERSAGDTVYISLGADISYKGEDGVLATNGANVVLDLCGYKLSWLDTTANDRDVFLVTDLDRSFLNGRNGTITIYDSQRYNADKNLWIGGVIQYEFDNASDLWRSCSCVLTGDVILHSGSIINKTWTSFSTNHHSAYRGSSLVMYGGSLQADQPVWLTESAKESAILGGQIFVMRDAAITVELRRSVFPGLVAPKLESCLVWNLSGREDTVAVCGVLPDGFSSIHAAEDAFEEFKGLFPETTHVYTDGEERSMALTTIYDGSTISGPIFTLTYELKKETVDFTVTAPAVGKLADYTVTGAESFVYDTALTWQYEETAGHFTSWTGSQPFKSGKTYRAVINLTPKEGLTEANVAADLASYKSIKINGKTAVRNGNSFYADFTIKDEYFNVYIGSTRISTTNKGDVLGDGGSVQFFAKGEYQVVDYGYDYGKQLPTLVLNNFKMKNDDYHDDGVHKAQIYIFEPINIVLRGANELYEGGTADGIYTGKFLNFYGDGKLYVNTAKNHRNALSAYNTIISFNDKVEIAFRGEQGIYMTPHSGTPTVVLQDSAKVYCFSYETTSGTYLPALECEYIELYDNALLSCRALSSTGVAMSTHPAVFDNKYFDVKLLKKGEQLDNPYKPYAPENGLNVSGGVSESDCWSVEITGKTVAAEGIRLYPDSLTITPDNNNKKLNVTLLPVEAAAFSDELTVKSSNESVLTVAPGDNGNYILTGIANGKATVTVTASGGASAKCEVTVEDFEANGNLVLKCDVNGDGKINARDVILVMQAVVATNTGNEMPKGFIFDAADAHTDGKINSRDVIAVMNAVIAAQAK